MDTMIKSFKLLLALFVVEALLAASCTNAHDHEGVPPTNPMCSKAENPALCSVLVKGATNCHDATFNAINSTIDAVMQVKQMTRDLNAASPTLPLLAKSSAAKVCCSTVTDILEKLNKALCDLKSGSIAALRRDISAASFSDCSDGLQKLHVGNPLIGFNQRYNDMTGAILTVSEKL